MLGAPDNHDLHDLDRHSDSVREITPATTPAFNPEQITQSKDGRMDPAPEAGHSSEVEPNTDFTPKEACDTGPPNPYPAVGSRPRTSEPAESGWAPVMEFTATDIFQHSPFGDMLNSLKSLSLSGGS